jgi:DNA polymerase-3 subunit chi
MDDLLWTFDERSFVPHRLCREPGAAAPVALTATAEGAPPADVLVNLRGGPPEMPLRYPRIAEIVDADAERRRLGRERFKFYREMKIPLKTHQLDETLSV